MSAEFDLTRLRVLSAVARTGSVTAAAKELGYAQPSVSHHLSRLESDAGIPLLRRHGRGVQLTEAGHLLANRAEEILGRVEAARREIGALAGLRAGRVRLAAFPSALATLVPHAVSQLIREHPGLSVELVEHEPPDAVTALRSGAVDVALVFEHGDVRHSRSVDDLSRFESTTILDEPVNLVTAADLDTAPTPDRIPSLKAFEGAEWIAGCERCRADLVARCAAVGFTPRIAFETDDYVAVQALVAAGAGVSLLPSLTLHAHRHSGIATAALPGAVRHVMALTVGPPAPPAQALIRQLVATGINLPV